MPPKSNIKKRCRRRIGARPYKNYSEEMLLMAVDLVKNKHTTSYDAEKQFGIPRRTIENRVKNLHSPKPGPRFRLSEEEELKLVKVLIAAGDYGSPLSQLDFKLVVYDYLKKNNKTYIFNYKSPGDWWIRNFLERHKDKLTLRSIQNITKARAEKTLDEFKEYFNNLESSLQNIPPSNILNYDETNVSDDPGSTKCIFRRGIKYPERIMNHSKSCISIMFAATAEGILLPPYVVFKSENLWEAWCKDGPIDARYNRTKSGWFDSTMFLDWFTKILIPWASKLDGPKVVIGDNLSSHLNPDVIELCEANNIRFVFLPPRSTQITQPLDVAFFGPLKKAWREILLKYKTENPKQTSLNKCHFPLLLNQLIEAANMKKQNIVSGFKATGIHPFNPYEVYKKMPEYEDDGIRYDVDQALLDYFKENKRPNPLNPRKNTKLNVLPGTSVSSAEIAEISLNKKIKKGNTNGTKKNSVPRKRTNKQQNIKTCTSKKARQVCKDTSIKSTGKQQKTKFNKKYVDTTDSNSTCTIPSCDSSEYDPKNDEISDEEKEINADVINDNKNIEVVENPETNRDRGIFDDMEIEQKNDEMMQSTKNEEEYTDEKGEEEREDYRDKELIKERISKQNLIKPMMKETKKIEKYSGNKVTILSEIKNTPENKKYFDLKKHGPLSLKSVSKENKLVLHPKKITTICEDNENFNQNYDSSEHENKTSVQHDLVTASCSKVIEQHIMISYNINNHILVRYISQKKVEYFIGKIIAKVGHKYKVSFYKRHGRSDCTKFTQPFIEDVDTVDERMIVKEVELLPLNEQNTEFVFSDDDDLVYFDY